MKNNNREELIKSSIKILRDTTKIIEKSIENGEKLPVTITCASPYHTTIENSRQNGVFSGTQTQYTKSIAFNTNVYSAIDITISQGMDFSYKFSVPEKDKLFQSLFDAIEELKEAKKGYEISKSINILDEFYVKE